MFITYLHLGLYGVGCSINIIHPKCGGQTKSFRSMV